MLGPNINAHNQGCLFSQPGGKKIGHSMASQLAGKTCKMKLFTFDQQDVALTVVPLARFCFAALKGIQLVPFVHNCGLQMWVYHVAALDGA